jgi:hypothetical protein
LGKKFFPFSHFDEGFAKTMECDNLGHTIKDLEPCEEVYKEGLSNG